MMKTEPVVTVGSIGAAAAAVLALLVAFGAPLTDDQQVAILGVVAVAAPVVVALVARRMVTPNGRVVESTPDGVTVLAGEANELPTDTMIRDLGDDDYEPKYAAD